MGLVLPVARVSDRALQEARPQPSLALRLGLATVVSWPSLDTSAEVESAVDERKMRERLRKISQLAVFFGIVFFRQKADIVAQRKQMLEKRARFVDPALQDVVVNHPKTTGEKGSFVPHQAVHRASGVITCDQAILHQVLLDRGHCALDAVVFRREKSDQRQ
jgi:hypothetical protein